MTYSNWRGELSEGAKTRLVIKGLKAIKSVIKKGGKKITRDVGSIGAPKASGRVIRRNPDKSGVSGKSLERRVQDRNRKQNPNISSPSTDAKQLISKKEKGEYVPISKEMSQKIKDALKKLRGKNVNEGVASLAVKGGSKLIPALMTGIGAAGTILQAKRGRPEGGAAKRYKRKNPNKKRTLSAAEKKIFGGQKKDIMQKGSDELKTKGLIKRGDKFTKQTTRGTSKNSDAGYVTEPTIEKSPTFTGRVDPTKGAPTPKRTTFKKSTKLTPENQFEDAIPTNNASSGNIAGLPPDQPPMRKKKRYIYGGKGSRKMWMNNK